MRLLGGMAQHLLCDEKIATACAHFDTMLRISYLIGIFKALNILHGKALADRWVSLRIAIRSFTAVLRWNS